MKARTFTKYFLPAFNFFTVITFFFVVKRVKSLGKKKIKITVKKSSKQVSGYEVILSTKKNFKNAKKITTKKNVITVKKLKAGKKYFVKVRAFKKVGNKKIYGNYSTVKKVIVKK